MELSLEEAGFFGNILKIRDLWIHNDCECKRILQVEVKPHGTLVYRVEGEIVRAVPNKDDKGEYIWKPLEQITLEQAYSYVEKENALFVDVRTKEEYEAGHLESAVNIPYMDIHAIAGDTLKDKTQPVIVYCAR